MKSIKYNYYNLMNIKPHKYTFIFIITLVLCLIMCFLVSFEEYSKKDYYAVFKDGHLYVKTEIYNSDTIINGDFLKINNNEYKYKVESISDLQVDDLNNLNYQIYTISTDYISLNNEMNVITIYYDKQRIYKKIWKMLF